MQTLAPVLDQGEAVMAGVNVKEVRVERLFGVVAQPKAKNVGVELSGSLDFGAHQHDVAQSQSTCLEPSDGAFQAKWFMRRCVLVSPADLHATSERIVEPD